MLAPRDLPAITAHLGRSDPTAFAREALVVSEGPTLGLSGGRVITLPTLVPRSDATGSCIFYKQGRCSIHAVSPFGCSYIDAHMTDAQVEQRTHAMYATLLADHRGNGPYAQTCAELTSLGLVAQPRDVRQARLMAAIRREFTPESWNAARP